MGQAVTPQQFQVFVDYQTQMARAKGKFCNHMVRLTYYGN